jgi:hypothetical protein
VRDHHHGAGFVREVAQLLHDRLVQARVKPRGGFVQEQQGRLGQQFLGHVDPLQLAAG